MPPMEARRASEAWDAEHPSLARQASRGALFLAARLTCQVVFRDAAHCLSDIAAGQRGEGEFRTTREVPFAAGPGLNFVGEAAPEAKPLGSHARRRPADRSLSDW